jgi:hypothetical protein
MNNRFLGIAMFISVLRIFPDSLANSSALGDMFTDLTYLLFGIGGM